MSNVPLISTGSHRYEGVWLKGGDPFVANNETDASDLCALGFAKRVPGYMTRDLAAEQDAMAAVRTKRAYKRRDLVAEK